MGAATNLGKRETVFAAGTHESEASEAVLIRRGPFRPVAWVNSRQREALRLRTFLYRGIDIAAALGLTLFWMGGTTYLPRFIPNIAAMSLAAAAPYLLGLYLSLTFLRVTDLYSFSRTRGVFSHAMLVMGAVLVGTLPALVIQFVIAPQQLTHFSQWIMLLSFLMGALHLSWASIINSGRLSGALIPNVVVVGATEDAKRIIDHALTHRDMNVIAVFDDRISRAPDDVCGVPVLGSISELIASHVAPYVDTVAVAIDPAASDRIGTITRKLSVLPNNVVVVFNPDDGNNTLSKRSLKRLTRLPVAMLSGTSNADRSAFIKRLQDIVLSGTALIVLSPLLVLIALWIRLDSQGPSLFRQKRHGFNQEVITVWKFRTMQHDRADADATRQVAIDDDRVTRAGRFLRVSSLDELPQLLNVLRGEMSLVGPRPHAIGMKTGTVQSSSIVSEYAHRHRIKPGLTGWAAINGSRGPLHTAAEVRQRVQLDIEYIDRQSFWLDTWIILRTIPVLLGDRITAR